MAAVIAIKARFPDARLPHPVFAGVVGAFAAGLPDLLEPAITPRHRQICHSVAFASLMVVTLKAIYDWNPQTEGQKLLRDVLLSIGVGYLSHLGADATTAAGLPWIGSIS
jgi:membrane-bound metal-dependent hydrolase YbcI (DUF457 family)